MEERYSVTIEEGLKSAGYEITTTRWLNDYDAEYDRTWHMYHDKGFEIVVRMAQPQTLMTSYNQLNHTYTANHRELVTDILRCEWGFGGLVMTDWRSYSENAGRPEKCVAAGNDLIMPGSDWDVERIRAAMEQGILSADAVRRCAARVLGLIEQCRTVEL